MNLPLLSTIKYSKNTQMLINNRGSTLIGTLIGMGINGVLALAAIQLHNNSTQVVFKNSLMVTKQQLINEIDMIPHFSGTYIQDSLESNTQIKNCIKSAGTCQETPITNFALQLHGTYFINGNTGAFYSAKGVPCNSWSELCPFKVTAIITPNCPTSSSSCKKAEGFLFTFNIKIHPDIKERYSLVDITNRNIYIHHSIFDENRNILASQQCPTGEIVESINEDGSINCITQPEIIRKHITYIQTSGGSYSTTTTGGDGDGGPGGPDGPDGSSSPGSCPR